MIINNESVEMIRANALRLANCIGNKDDLVDLATASSFEQVFTAIETILTNTDMFFDDNFIDNLTVTSWPNFKAILLVYTLNILNKKLNINKETNYTAPTNLEFVASYHHQ